MADDRVSRRSLLSLRLTGDDAPERRPPPYPLPDEGAPGLMAALEPLSAVVREIAGEGALDLSVGTHHGLDSLPYAGASFPAVASVLGVALAPRPRRAGRELLRVTRPGGLIVLAAPLPRSLVARTLALTRQAGPSPLLWGDEETVRARLPGAEVEAREHTLRVVFESVEAAWEAAGMPFGVKARRRFEQMAAEHSPGAGEVSMQDRWRIVLARTAG